MSVEVHGLDALVGETAFAFLVVRMAREVQRDQLVELLRYIAPLIPDSDTFIDELPEDLEQSIRILAMPWAPPEAGHAVDAQRRLIESTGALGVETAWFFQTGTSLPGDDSDEDETDDDDDDDLDDASELVASEDTGVVGVRGRARTKPERGSRAMTTDDGWVGEASWNNQLTWTTGEVGGDTITKPIEIVDMTGERDLDFDDDVEADDAARGRELADARQADHDDDAGWSHGLPPQVTNVRFPVDGYPAILDALDWEDVGVAFKLEGDMLAGEGTVLFAFHTLWLAPYAGRYRNAAVTIDRAHHSVHLWVDRFAVPCSAEEQIHHLLWVLTKLDEVLPIAHARFAGATTAQKYAGLTGDASEPFVLGGNPLLAIHARDGEAAVDRWIAEQTEWSREEVAQMLRELAIELVTAGESSADGDAPGPAAPDAPAYDEDDEGDDDDDDDYDDDGDDYADDDDDDDDDEAEGNEDEDRGRQITSVAGELLAARASAGLLDPRTAERLLPVLHTAQKFEHRRRAVVHVLGALRYRPAVPALVGILDGTPIRASRDAVGKEELVAATAAALGAIGDPAAIPALTRLVAAARTHDVEWRAVAANALAACLAAAPESRQIDDDEEMN